MTAEFIAPLQAVAAAPVPPMLQPAATAQAGTGFTDLVSQGLQAVNQQVLGSQVDLQRLAAGETASLHQVMIRLEETRISMQLMLQVRNRLLESYQELMRMQV